MNPQDIDKIADVVVHSLAGPGAGLLGCGALSSPEQFETHSLFECGTYECGHAAAFGCCAYDQFTCYTSFFCYGPAVFAAAGPSDWYMCYEGYVSLCRELFFCLPSDVFDPRGHWCDVPPPPI